MDNYQGTIISKNIEQKIYRVCFLPYHYLHITTDDCIDKIDQALNVQSEIKSNTLSTDELLIELRKLSIENRSNDNLAIHFSELVRKSQINHDLINSFIEFNSSKYIRQTILSQGRFQLFIICWQKGQKSLPHQNLRYFTESFVFKGQLTKTKLKQVMQKDVPKNVIDHEQVYSEGEWLSTNEDELHQFANFHSDNLVTLHYKYYSNNFSNPHKVSNPEEVLFGSDIDEPSTVLNSSQLSPSKIDIFP